MTVVSFGKRIIPDPIRPLVARCYHDIRIGFQTAKLKSREGLSDRFLLSNSLGRHLFYRVFSTGFDAEQKAALAGRLAYLNERKSATRSRYLLRRNIHRIEKGLVSEHPRKAFALDYIEQTISELAAVSTTSSEPTEYLWARDVLTAYFRKVIHTDKRVQSAYEKFSALCPETIDPSTPNIPYIRDLSTTPVDIENLKDLSIRRRSVRSYIPKPVPRALVDQAVDVARFSPSACNRQAFTFRIFDTPEAAQSVAKLPMGTTSFIDNINAIVVVVGHLRAYPYARDRHAVYVDASLAAMSFVYGLEAQGIASCVINWADDPKRERAAAKQLGLQADDRIMMMISYGWPNPNIPVPFSAKRPVSDMRNFEAST